MGPIYSQPFDFEHPTLHNPHGKQKVGITMLSNLSISEETKTSASKHLNSNIHDHYQLLTE